MVAGVHAYTDSTCVPSVTRRVVAAAQPSTGPASNPHGSLTHTPARPRSSARRTSAASASGRWYRRRIDTAGLILIVETIIAF